MLGKVISGTIFVFWITMTSALVRVEFFPQPMMMNSVPSIRIIEKVFKNPEPARLKVFYKATNVGFCNIEIHPISQDSSIILGPSTNQLAAFRINSDLNMMLSIFGNSTRFQIRSESYFDDKYEMNNFQFNAFVGEGRMHGKGDKRSGLVRVGFDLGDVHEERVLRYGDLDGNGLGSLLGVPGLAGSSLINGKLPSELATFESSVRSESSPQTTTSKSRIVIGNDSLLVYLIESHVNDRVWAKIWIDERGEVLLVETSAGITMKSEMLADDVLISTPKQNQSIWG